MSKPSLDQKIIEIAQFIERHFDEPLSLGQLARQAGWSEAYFQKRFKAFMGLSPKAYQDIWRQKHLKTLLKSEQGIAGAIFEAGFGSTSRVYGEPKRGLGMSLRAYGRGGEGEHIAYALCQTGLGHLIMAATQKGVCCVQFADTASEALGLLKAEFPKAELELAPEGEALQAWLMMLNDYLAHKGPRPEVPLDIRGTLFQQKVWTCLRGLAEHETLTYQQLAERLGMPKAVRAAASGCAANRIAVLIPCHKVLRSDGGLGGFRWGLERKQALLAAQASL